MKRFKAFNVITGSVLGLVLLGTLYSPAVSGPMAKDNYKKAKKGYPGEVVYVDYMYDFLD